MSLFTIAWRSILQRGVASALTCLSMALGVMLVVAVLTIHGVLSKSFYSNASLGYNLIVGAKGGKEQLVLNTVFYLSAPVENVSYDYYMEFLKRGDRAVLLKDSLKLRGHEQLWQTAELANFGIAAGVEQLAIESALTGEKQIDVTWNSLNRNGEYGSQCDLVIPVCLGDYYGRFRVVGTTPAMFNDLVWDLENNRKYEFAQGRNFQHRSVEHGYFEAVVGSHVAREMDLKVGDQFSPAHGAVDGHSHERKFTIVGILKGSGTPIDKGVYVNMEGFYLMEDHAKSVVDPREARKNPGEPREQLSDEEERQKFFNNQRKKGMLEREPDPDPLPTEQREVTALLIKTEMKQGLYLEGAINKDKKNGAQAVAPVAVIVGMFEFLVRPVQFTLLALTSVICVVSGISILVSIYNSMNDRRHEIAVMRALGADRYTVSRVILYEAVLLSLGGCAIGWLFGHLACLIASPWIEIQTGFAIGFHGFGEPFFYPFERVLPSLSEKVYFPVEWLIVPALVVLSIIVGIWPALSAYRTDVAQSLGK
ncbi:ABC transporter permease [Anatilimnocola floriformis]|uniref:ABC transporter permease n=1 Tax=Anatilimnocola floriformis TaxID=2948575 RepID=UPI0020C1EA08|nr:ABC transporter permease [Anatilimnocola floriformis]